MDNKLLARIPRDELDRLRPHLKDVELRHMMVLSHHDEIITDVYFPTSGVISMVNEPDNGDIVEFATVGNEGMAGFPVIMGAPAMPSRAIVQVPGAGYQVKASKFLELLKELPGLNRLLLRYVMVVLNYAAQSSACNRLHEVQERCARWLLHTHDRIDGDKFMLTQEFLSQMLGVHRPTVSIAAGMLQQAGLIRYSRGSIQVIDREGLEAASCPCYRLVADQYTALLESN